jgi:hypothetical protein
MQIEWSEAGDAPSRDRCNGVREEIDGEFQNGSGGHSVGEWNRGAGVEATTAECRRASASGGTDAGSGSVGSAGSARSSSECEPGVSLASTVSAWIAGWEGAAGWRTVAGEGFRECGDDGDGGQRFRVTAAIAPKAASAIQIELAKGRVRIEGKADLEMLRVGLECLAR